MSVHVRLKLFHLAMHLVFKPFPSLFSLGNPSRKSTIAKENKLLTQRSLPAIVQFICKNTLFVIREWALAFVVSEMVLVKSDRNGSSQVPR